MGDTLTAFIEFLVDLFSALSNFLGGGDFDLSSMLNGLLGGEEEEESSSEEASSENA